MTDRELLELAAKAAGIELENFPWIHRGPEGAAFLANGKFWNPRDDDGDCARMEAALLIDVAWHHDRVEADGRQTMFTQVAYFDEYGDRQAARRAASLQVAAAIGKAMP